MGRYGSAWIQGMLAGAEAGGEDGASGFSFTAAGNKFNENFYGQATQDVRNAGIPVDMLVRALEMNTAASKETKDAINENRLIVKPVGKPPATAPTVGTSNGGWLPDH